MANTFDSIVISTGLVDLTSKSVLENVLGQLSDGMWGKLKSNGTLLAVCRSRDDRR